MTTDGSIHGDRLTALRAAMRAENIQAYIVPRSDEYLGEYVPDCADRLAWLTGFTGSAGNAVVLADKALVVSDGRYTLQLERQVDGALFQTGITPAVTLSGWLGNQLPEDAVVGYDPRTLTGPTLAVLKDKGLNLKPVAGNLVDRVWTDRPAPPHSPVVAFPESIAGRGSAAKRQGILADLVEERKGRAFQALVLNAPDSIAWLLNIRGGDVPHNPFALSSAVLYADGQLDWYIAADRLDGDVRASLGNAVRVVAPADLEAGLRQLAATDGVVLLDDAQTPAWFRETLQAAGAVVDHVRDPCILPRACKTQAEQDGIRAAHLRDGVALAKFFAWLDREAEGGALSELDAVDRLARIRAESPEFRDTSFDTIAGWAGNGAIVHYRATAETSLRIAPPGLLLVDSGAQYPDGTTDVTRTIAVGPPSAAMRRHYTLVLKGHVALASAAFPQGTKGRDLDVLARQFLWADELDYAHGTGHGVGCYLSVHENGVGISSRAEDELRPGMLVSNEPGYYRADAYGIRIENLLLVREDGTIRDGGLRKRLSFETVTLAPYDRRLIDYDLLTAIEIAWIDNYHGRVRSALSPLLESDDRQWLLAMTAPLGRSD